MKMINIGIKIFVGLIALQILWFAYEKAVREPDCLSVDIFVIDSGYGYSISCYEKKLIYQPFIPALEGNIPFKNEKDAMKTGTLVLDRLSNGQHPTITKVDLEELGVIF